MRNVQQQTNKGTERDLPFLIYTWLKQIETHDAMRVRVPVRTDSGTMFGGLLQAEEQSVSQHTQKYRVGDKKKQRLWHRFEGYYISQ